MRSWQFLKEFDGKLQSKKPAFQLTLKFFNMMQQNKRLHQFFLTMLSVGNCLNSGTPRGTAYGFKLKTLSKFCGSKDTRNKKTILHYCLQIAEITDATFVRENEQVVVNVQKYMDALKKNIVSDTDPVWDSTGPIMPAVQEFCIVYKQLMRVGFEDELAQLEQMKQQLADVKKNIPTLQSKNPNDKYTEVFNAFADKADFQIQRALEIASEAKESYQKCLRAFAEPLAESMNDFLKNLEEFAAALEKCQEDNRLEKEKQEREAKRAARKAQMEKDAKNGKSANSVGGN